MNLQAKLTLAFILLVVVIVSTISVIDLGNTMQLQFEGTLERADVINPIATRFVMDTRNSQLDVSLREALRAKSLSNDLLDLLTNAKAILEIAVVDPKTEEILADSDPRFLGQTSGPYPDFRDLVQHAGLLTKLRVLLSHSPDYYKIERPLSTPSKEPVLLVRVIVAPALIYNAMKPSLTRKANVALAFIILAVAATFLVSAIAFRPLGRLRHQLDLIASGEFEPEKAAVPAVAGHAAAAAGRFARHERKPATDELSLMASKVSLLGQRLRGAQFEVSDLRGNIDRLLHDLEDAVFIFNRERRLVFASGSVEKFLGRERDGLAGQSIAEIFPPAAPLGLLVAQSSQTGRSLRNRRVPVVAAGDGVPGSAVVLLSVDTLDTVPGGVAAGSGLLVRLRDPEAQRKIGRELRTADRLAAISRISGGVAHEVKNPLNAILLHVEVAKARLSRGETDVNQQMEIISREILRLDRVVKTFLDFSRPVELNLSTVFLQDLMGEIVELARPQAEAAKIEVTVVQEAEGVEVRVDRDLMKQAVLNVVVNAIEAMPSGGELRFEASAGEDTAEIRVSDTGSGIPPELREKIFRLYFTTRKEGSGIGLAMTFRIVQLHDGTIDFASEPGKGTTFFIRLPIAV
jgi:signal transduction histidine kinase